MRRRHSMHRRTAGNRGSALLISLMIMVGLSLLGLGFVAISETESAISVNERHAAQTQAIAEAGGRAVVEFFQDPRWALNEGFLPANNDAQLTGGYKRSRVVGGYTGVYRAGDTSALLLDRPYRPDSQNRFYGDDGTADLVFHRGNAASRTCLTNLNTALFGADSPVSGRIEEIRIYAPPIINGTLTGGFWVGGDRYGLATIKVTAEKWSREVTVSGVVQPSGQLLSRRVVRIIVGEFPIPAPGGPLQTTAGAAFGGTADVHWGDVTAYGAFTAGGAALPSSTFPWANPYQHPPFETAYDPLVFGAGTDYLKELVGKSYGDPWFGIRTRGNNGECDPNCGTYDQGDDETNIDFASFEDQTTNTFPTSKLVTFPDIRYEYWKRIALAGRGMKGIYYFTWVDGNCTYGPPCFKKNGQGVAKGFGYWVNTLSDAKLGSGFYFFDTEDGQRPRDVDDASLTNLTENIELNSGSTTSPFRMEGWIYVNAYQYGSSGVSIPTGYFNMPSEIFQDIGYRQVDPLTRLWVTPHTPIGVANGIWDYQDLNGNGVFDLVLSPSTTTFVSVPPYAGQQATYLPVTWNGGAGAPCTVATCSEPHEPYINFVYPATGTGATVAKWQAAGSQDRSPKRQGVVCTGTPSDDDCTSNKYDGPRSDNANDTGPVVALEDILLNGILYNEGRYNSSGNAGYYGSLLVRGPASATGNPEIWFDQRLLRGDPPRNFPRVMIFSSETDPAF